MMVVAAIGVALQLQMPSRFNWDATFSPNDPNPFGCLLFDSVLTASMPNGYRAEKTTLYKSLDSAQVRNVLIIANSMELDSLEVTNIDSLTRRGSKVMIVTDETYYYYQRDADSVGIDISGGYSFNIQTLRKELGARKNIMDTISFRGDKQYAPHKYKVLYQLLNYAKVEYPISNSKKGISWDTLAYADVRVDSLIRNGKSHRIPIVLRRKKNNGELIFVTSNLLFTNYGMLEEDASDFIYRTMSLIADKPVIRITNEERTEAEWERNNTPFRAIFKVQALKWAFYLTLLVLLAFFFFTSRRRQRAIPVISPPRNHTLEFVQLIGTLFYQRHDHAGLVRRKWEMFAVKIRQNVGVDVQSLDDDDTLFTRLSERTGIPYEKIATTIKRIRYIVMNDNDITARQMMSVIDNMNEIEEKTR